MGKRRKYVLLVAIVLVVVGLVYGAFRYEPEPEYGGRSLSEWVKAYGTNYTDGSYAYSVPVGHLPVSKSAAADEAIRAIGTNAIPYLVKWVRYQRPPWKRRLLAVVNRLVPRSNMTDQAQVKADNSIDALMALGPNAKGAVPALGEVLRRREESIVAVRAVEVLFRLGTEGLPPLLDALTNGPPSFARALIVTGMGRAGTNAQAAVPALRALLKRPGIGELASNALQRMESQAADVSLR